MSLNRVRILASRCGSWRIEFNSNSFGGRLFYNVAGHPHKIEATRSRQTNRRFHATSAARSLFAAATRA